MTSATLTRSHIQRTLEFGIVAASENGASCISFAGNNLAARTLSPNGTMESVFHRRRNPHVILILLD